MSRPSLVVHGHFYQPPRLDPSPDGPRCDPTAAPARDWNSRISADCYRPNAELGNLGAMSWDLGPTLAGWMATTAATRSPTAGSSTAIAGVNGLAQPFHHTILPLASAADRRTEIRWGLRDFEVRFGRRRDRDVAARDRGRPGIAPAAGRRGHRPHHPRPVAGRRRTTSTPGGRYRVDLGDGRSMVVAHLRRRCCRRRSRSSRRRRSTPMPSSATGSCRASPEAPLPDGVDPLVIIATDGELYGHHQPLREHFLARLVGATAPADRAFATPSLGAALAAAAASERPLPDVRLRERTSWSCHHGIARWAAGCDCAADVRVEAAPAHGVRATRRRDRRGDRGGGRTAPRRDPIRGPPARPTSTSSSARSTGRRSPTRGSARAPRRPSARPSST